MLFGRVTIEFQIGLKEVKALALEQICVVALESSIQRFLEE